MAQATKWLPAILDYMKKVKLNISTSRPPALDGACNNQGSRQKQKKQKNKKKKKQQKKKNNNNNKIMRVAGTS